MHSLNWINRISSGQADVADVISERLPVSHDTWLPVSQVKHYSLVYVVDRSEGKTLLGYKKRGMGINLWNGFGGKPYVDESMEACAKRELEEEAGLMGISLTYKGQFVITDSNGPLREGSDTSALIWIYVCDKWKGDPIETEEMIPKWFRLPSAPTRKNAFGDKLEDIPVDAIWPEQRFFLSKLLDMTAQEGMYGRVDYDTLSAQTSLDSLMGEAQLVTRDQKHRLKSWRFVRVKQEVLVGYRDS
ncbi:hypothetical protein NliqN6_3684 [Naganishia liquefaciens]|uniref:Nudix hydrolase domain-containing protein n=1 Tax=Naganishia liquefaciens TaxID=104408 RepID=A0A8H3YGJ4_9TREE|nr:hypothetical protein NliqN6_3684 [Naganishia liquefaciens]